MRLFLKYLASTDHKVIGLLYAGTSFCFLLVGFALVLAMGIVAEVITNNVIVHLSSKDMIHGFALPQMRVKQDVIPGIAQPVWFTPTQTGAWEIACSQLCGLGHYRMRGFYTIHTQAEYDAWLAEETALLVAP